MTEATRTTSRKNYMELEDARMNLNAIKSNILEAFGDYGKVVMELVDRYTDETIQNSKPKEVASRKKYYKQIEDALNTLKHPTPTPAIP